MATTVAATITAMGWTSTNSIAIVDFVVAYHVASDSYVSGLLDGEIVLTADITQNETQISLALRTALAAYLNTKLVPNPGISANEVRGCNV